MIYQAQDMSLSHVHMTAGLRGFSAASKVLSLVMEWKLRVISSKYQSIRPPSIVFFSIKLVMTLTIDNESGVGTSVNIHCCVLRFTSPRT